MKFTLASILLLATTAAAVPATKPKTTTTTTKKPTPPPTPTTTTTSAPLPVMTADPDAPNPWVPSHLMSAPVACDRRTFPYGSITCDIHEVDPLDVNAKPAALTSYQWALGQINYRFGSGRDNTCMSTKSGVWEVVYCGMGPRNMGGVKISTWVNEFHFGFNSCYELWQALQCFDMDCTRSNYVMGGMDMSYGNGAVQRYVKIEKPTEADRAVCGGCGLWGDVQCA